MTTTKAPRMTETNGYRHADLNAVTRGAVLAAVAECDRVGMDAFLAEHGYRPSLRYQLRFRGRSYPSKAVLGVAAGLASSEFFGGAAVVVRHLTRLGFQVREGRRVVTAAGLLDLARQALAESGAPTAWQIPALAVEPAAYFASGTNRAAEIRGMASVGQDVGVAAVEVSPTGEAALLALAGSDVQVFVDSGAFSEVEFTAAGPVVVREITGAEWEKRLALYARLAAGLGDQVWLVAPDRVGDQAVTLARLERYAPELRALAAAGARLLVPVQKGALSQADFAARVDEVLAGIEWHAAMPCKKAATTPAELGAFLAERSGTRHVHLLGLGPNNRKVGDYLEHVARAGCSVSLDSNWLTAHTGTGEKPGAQGLLFAAPARARLYTLAQGIARKALGAAATAVRELALVLSFGIASVLETLGGEE